MMVEETYDRMFTVSSRVKFPVTKEDDGVPVECIVDHPAAKDLQAQRHLEVLCEWLPKYSFPPGVEENATSMASCFAVVAAAVMGGGGGWCACVCVCVCVCVWGGGVLRSKLWCYQL